MARSSALEIEDDPRFTRIWWRVERGGWIALAALLAAALLGLLGRGPLSRATAGGDGGPLQVEYERFGYVQTDDRLKFRLAPGRSRTLWVSTEFLDGVEIRSIAPEPAEVRAASDRHLYEFAARPETPLTVTFEFTPLRAGRHRGRAGAADGPAVRFNSWIYP